LYKKINFFKYFHGRLSGAGNLHENRLRHVTYVTFCCVYVRFSYVFFVNEFGVVFNDFVKMSSAVSIFRSLTLFLAICCLSHGKCRSMILLKLNVMMS